MPTGQPQAAGDLREYTSISAADATTWRTPQEASFVQIIGAGTTVVTTEAGNNRTITTDAAEPAAVFEGVFTGFVSTTATRVRMGRGDPPAMAVPASAVPGTAAALGGVKLSVAPADPASPIAVGSNDPRVTVIEHVASFDGTDGSLAEEPIPSLGVACTVLSVTIEGSAAVTQSDTDFDTITLAKRDGAGGAPTTIAEATTEVTGGIAILAFREVSMGAIASAAVLATDKLTLASAATGAGQPIGRAKIRIVFSVP